MSCCIIYPSILSSQCFNEKYILFSLICYVCMQQKDTLFFLISFLPKKNKGNPMGSISCQNGSHFRRLEQSDVRCFSKCNVERSLLSLFPSMFPLIYWPFTHFWEQRKKDHIPCFERFLSSLNLHKISIFVHNLLFLSACLRLMTESMTQSLLTMRWACLKTISTFINNFMTIAIDCRLASNIELFVMQKIKLTDRKSVV